jgi:hypothetical protein
MTDYRLVSEPTVDLDIEAALNGQALLLAQADVTRRAFSSDLT